jgi:nucleotide-binding universal stress UspA family protein
MALRSRILYLVGFDSAEAAVTWQVAELSKAWQTPVVLLGVDPPQWLSFLARDRQRALKRRLLDVARRLRGLKGHVAGIKVAVGDARTEARRVADQIGAELIVTGAGPQSADDPLALSNIAFDIASRARQDVWICKPHADPQVDHVLCAADTSARAGVAVRLSVDLCRRFNARLRVLSVLEEPAGADPDETARAARQAQRDFLQQFDLGGVTLSRATVWGADATVELLLEAERYADGLLVMGATSGARSPGLGATAEPVLRACPSSILIVRRPCDAGAKLDAGTGVAAKHHADAGRDSRASPTSPPES